MTPEMAFESLVVCGDAGLMSVMKETLRKFSIEVEHCPNTATACEMIADRSHELVVIDWEGDASYRLLHAIWNLPNKRKPTILAISPDEKQVLGAHFTIQRPVLNCSATESMKKVYSRMVLDYRVTARYAVMIQLLARDDTGKSIPVTVTDIGEGGLGLTAKEYLTVGEALSLTLPLPQAPLPIHIHAQILWTRDYGAAGCYFLSIPPVDRDILRDWLKSRLRIKKPLVSV